MQETSTGFLLTPREALAAQHAAGERGFPELGEAVSENMLRYWTEDTQGYWTEDTRDREQRGPGHWRSVIAILIRQARSADDGQEAGFYHVTFGEIGNLSAQEVKEACAPTTDIMDEARTFDRKFQANLRLKENMRHSVAPPPPGPAPEDVGHPETNGGLGFLTR